MTIQDTTKSRLASAQRMFSNNPSAMHWNVLTNAMRAHQIAVYGAMLTLTTEIVGENTAYALTGQLIDHDGHLFDVAEFAFNRARIMDALHHYQTQFENVQHNEVTINL